MRAIVSIIIATVIAMGVAVLVSEPALAQASEIQKGINEVGGAGALSFETSLQNIINTFLFIIGAVAVIMIIFGGFRYVTSGGEASAVKSAKDTILYAVIGVIVAVLAYTITSFVIETVDSPQTWADCNRYASDRAKQAQCQRDMIEADAPDVPSNARPRSGVINQ